MTTPLIETTAAVCELNVFDPAVAKFFHADQGPVILVAVAYKLSFGAISVSQLNVGSGTWILHHPKQSGLAEVMSILSDG